ncbi:MAG: transposase [Deltaproteobacteria bacterium]|nr:transposase [Deltaproteobacteria bacterium]
MSHALKYYPKDSVLFITCSAEENLPFVPNMVINAILEGILARSQTLYPQEICGYTFMANHLHMMLRVTMPDLLADFMRYLKSESASAINRLLGRKQHTVWSEGYDSPIMLTPDMVTEKLAYIYLNPAKARLVNSIDDYPGLSSWKAVTEQETRKDVLWIKNSTITKLNKLEMNFSEQTEALQALKRKNSKMHELIITPNSWMKSFENLPNADHRAFNDELIRQVKYAEAEYKKAKPKIVGIRALIRTRINSEYESKRKGRRTLFISSDVALRIRAIRWRKIQSRLAREAWRLLKFGQKAEIPPGFYGPGRSISSNTIYFMDLIFA